MAEVIRVASWEASVPQQKDNMLRIHLLGERYTEFEGGECYNCWRERPDGLHVGTVYQHPDVAKAEPKLAQGKVGLCLKHMAKVLSEGKTV